MAYVRITPERVSLYTGDGGPSGAVFYQEDVQIVLNQPDVIGLTVAPAIVDGTPCHVIIGVIEKDSEGATRSRDNQDDPIGLACPPFDDPPGGIELPPP